MLACTSGGVEDTAPGSTPPGGDTDTSEPGTSACSPIDGPGEQEPLIPVLGADTNLLILSIDTLRKDRVGRYTDLDTTPFLDGWLADSLVLEEHRSCSDWTAPSMLCAFTGTTPTEAGYEPHAGTDTILVDLPSNLETLTSWLVESNRVPAVVTANAVVAEMHPADVDPRAVTLLDREPASTIVDTGLVVLESLQRLGTPWFLQLHFNDPHSPYDPPPEYLDGLDGLPESPVDLTDESAIVALASDPSSLGEQELALVVQHAEVRYQGEVRYLDDQLKRLWGELEGLGIPQDTLVVLLSDHGEQFFEHDSFTHGMTLHLEEVDAIAAIRAPGLEPGVWEGPTAHQDLAPTILTALGLASPAGVTAPVLGTAAADRSRHGFRQYREVPPLHVLTRGTHRLFYDWTGERSYHDLAVDPLEQVDSYDSENTEVLCLWEQLTPWIERAQQFMGDYTPVAPSP